MQSYPNWGLKMQHALRAFVQQQDRKAIRITAENYPISEYYDNKEVFNLPRK